LMMTLVSATTTAPGSDMEREHVIGLG
jgi:hypothetical protein